MVGDGHLVVFLVIHGFQGLDSFKPITLNFRYNDFVVANFLDDDRQWDVGKVKNFFIMLTKMLFCRVMWVI